MRPESEAELAEAVAGAAGPLWIEGGGTRFFGAPDGVPVLSTGGLSGIELYEPGALTLVAKAGVPLAEVETALSAEGQQLAFEPMDHRSLLGTTGEPTIGGVAAANVSGPRRVQAGACRDFLIGVRFVDGAGNILKNGGRVMKNVTGYDLVKLMAGSFGTLGVLSEVAFKVLPQAEAVAVLLFEDLSDQDAVRALTAALGSPFDVTGAAHAVTGPDGTPVTMIRVEGFAASVNYRADRLRGVLAAFGEPAVEIDAEKTRTLWRWVRDVEGFAGKVGDVWRISVKPTDGPGVAEALRRVSQVDILYDWGGGLVWALVPEGTDARAAMAGISGHATLVRGSEAAKGRVPVFHPEAEPLARISAGLRAKFDPRGILNPGRMG